MVQAPDFPISRKAREDYLELFCKSSGQNWNQCKRIKIKQALNLCPDFVLPDSEISPDEVIDRFDKENED